MSKRGSGEGSIHKRADGRWVAVLDLGWVNGKRKRKHLYAASQKEARERLTKARLDLDRGIRPADDKQTVEAFLKAWLRDDASARLRPSTLRSYTEIIHRHILPELGRKRLAKLTPKDVRDFLGAKLQATALRPVRGKGPVASEEAKLLSPRTVQYIHAVLRAALEQAVRDEVVSRNVAKLVKPPAANRDEVAPLSLEDAQRLLQAARGERLEAVFTVATALGLRRGEVVGLRWEDVDLDKGELRVRQQILRVAGKGLVATEPKTKNARRTINLPSFAIAALKAHAKRQKEERLEAGSLWQDTGLVFTTPIGTPIDPDNLRRSFKPLLERAGLPDKRFHDLRHTAASLLLAQGVDARAIMGILGHADIRTTLNVYAHVLPAAYRDAAERMDALLGPGSR